jgi:ABC-2 type transport system permease protein
MKLDESQQRPFNLTKISSIDDAKKQIRSQQLNGAIVIPDDFTDRITSDEQGTITIITDQSNPQISSLLTTMLEKTMGTISTQLGVQQVASLLPESPNPEALVQPFIVKTEGIVAGEPNYFQFMAPGIMVMVVMFAVMTGLAASIAREKEDGTLDGILVAPISRLTIILGKAFAQTTRGLLQAAVVLSLAVIIFGVVVHGSLLLVAMLLILGVFSFVGLGVLISAITTEQETAMSIMMTLQFPMLFLSGVFFPIQQMPEFIQGISKAIPLTYVIVALRKVIILGAGIPDVLTEITILAGFGVVMLAIAIPLFNRIITR